MSVISVNEKDIFVEKYSFISDCRYYKENA